MPELSIYHRRGLVGWLSLEPDEELTFRYADSWLDSPEAFPVSMSLPLQRGRIFDRPARFFFTNLLPEGAFRALIAQRLGLSADNDFKLLETIGGECAGALCVGTPATESTEARYRRLPDDELRRLADERTRLPFLLGSPGLRLSLAGAQGKLPVFVEGDAIELPLGGSPSSHLLKFPNPDFKHLPANETFTTMVARHAGLPVVEARLVRSGPLEFCLVTRYDRRLDESGRLVRIHQEDFCQAMGLPSSRKYQLEGGPGLAACHALVLEHSSDPFGDSEKLLTWGIANLLLGNADGHAKNLSLLVEEGRSIRLAPFYDLVCTSCYPLLDRSLAMAVGAAFDPGQVRGSDWKRLAGDMDVGKSFLIDLVAATCDHLLAAVDRAEAEFTSLYGSSPAPGMVAPRIRKQARRTRQLLTS